MAVLHATATVSGAANFSGSYDVQTLLPSCAEVAKTGSRPPDPVNGNSFYVPIPMAPRGASYGTVSGHVFSTDAAAHPYHGPGSYSGKSLSATQLDADTPAGSEEKGIFAFPDNIGTLTVNPDGSGSFKFDGLEDPGSARVSGTVVWTCS